MDELFNTNTSEYGTTEEKTVQPFEGKSYSFETRRYKAEDLPCVINERNAVVPLDDELANSIVNSVSTTVSFYKALSSLDTEVKEAIRAELPSILDGVIPQGFVDKDNLESMRKVLAKLNKIYKQSEDTRKAGKNIINKPYDYMNSIYKGKTNLIVSAIESLKSQIAVFDEAEDERKAKVIREMIIKKAADYSKDLPVLLDKYPALYNKVWKKEFLNKTMSDTKMQESIMASLVSIKSIIKTLDGEKDSTDLKATYFETGDLTLALQKKQSMDEARAMIERMSEPTPTPKAEPKPSTPSIPFPDITLTDYGPGKDQYFHAWHSDPKAFKGLLEYMKANGFRCEGIGKIVEYFKSLNA